MPVDGALNAPGEIAEVTNTRSPQTMGDDQPRPGTSMDQATLSVFDHRSGSDEPSATPAPCGPRNWGHSVGPPAPMAAVSVSPTSRVTARRRMTGDHTARAVGWDGDCDE